MSIVFWTLFLTELLVNEAKIGADRNGIVTLQHGSFKCLGALLDPVDVLTCCTCVSDVEFSQTKSTDMVRYSIKPMKASNISVTSGDEMVVARDVLLHPQCDMDGSYDYAVVKLKEPFEAESSLDRIVGRVRVYSTNIKDISRRLRKRDGKCVLFTTFEDGGDKQRKINTRFTSWRHCSNGSEPKSLNGQHCIKSLDNSDISEAKSGSPVFCEGKLVGVLARKFALGGKQYSSVNGLDAALDFIKDSLSEIEVRNDEESETESLLSRRVNSKSKKKKKLLGNIEQ